MVSMYFQDVLANHFMLDREIAKVVYNANSLTIKVGGSARNLMGRRKAGPRQPTSPKKPLHLHHLHLSPHVLYRLRTASNRTA